MSQQCNFFLCSFVWVERPLAELDRRLSTGKTTAAAMSVYSYIDAVPPRVESSEQLWQWNTLPRRLPRMSWAGWPAVMSGRLPDLEGRLCNGSGDHVRWKMDELMARCPAIGGWRGNSSRCSQVRYFLLPSLVSFSSSLVGKMKLVTRAFEMSWSSTSSS